MTTDSQAPTRWRRLFWALCCLIGQLVGCAAEQSVSGTWTGRVETLRVFAADGSSVEVAALRVRDAPPDYATTTTRDWKLSFKDYMAQQLGAGFSSGELPLLADQRTGCALAPLKGLTGRQVRLEGRMMAAPLHAPDRPRLGIHRVHRPTDDPARDEEHALFVTEGPKAID